MTCWTMCVCFSNFPESLGGRSSAPCWRLFRSCPSHYRSPVHGLQFIIEVLYTGCSPIQLRKDQMRRRRYCDSTAAQRADISQHVRSHGMHPNDYTCLLLTRIPGRDEIEPLRDAKTFAKMGDSTSTPISPRSRQGRNYTNDHLQNRFHLPNLQADLHDPTCVKQPRMTRFDPE